MHSREDFIRSIIAAPEDDTVRLVFADWLDENGEPERAEYIRRKVADPDDIVRLGPTDTLRFKNAPMYRGCRKLKHRGDFPDGYMAIRRGFPYRFNALFDEVMYHDTVVAELFGNYPIEEWHLTDKMPRPFNGTDDRNGVYWEPGIEYNLSHQLPFCVGVSGGWEPSFIGGLMIYRFLDTRVALKAMNTSCALLGHQTYAELERLREVV